MGPPKLDAGTGKGMIASGCGDGTGSAAEPVAVVNDGRAGVVEHGADATAAGVLVICASVFTVGISAWRRGDHSMTDTAGKGV